MSVAFDQQLLAALRRSNFSDFARAAFHVFAPGETLRWNWHLNAICYQLEQVLCGATKRLIIEVPPRSLKSFLVSVAFPAFCLGKAPSDKIIAISYSMDLSTKLSNDCRALMRSPWYRALFPHAAIFAKDTETEFATTAGGSRYATSSGGTLTGLGGRLIILDDPQKAEDAQSASKRRTLQEWFRNSLFSRLNDRKDGAIILVMQRLHIDDLAGHLRATGNWRILSLPAIAVEAAQIQTGPDSFHHRAVGDLLHPAREAQAELDDLKATMGSYNFSAQYQQQPVPVEGEIVKWAWFRRFRELPDREYKIVQSWDVAVKGEDIHDYSVCTTWAIVGRDYWLLDVVRERLAFPALRARAIELAGRRRADTILIEDKGSGSALIQSLNERRMVAIPRPIAINPKLDKITRLSQESATIEAGQVFLPEKAPWLDEFRSELAQFPHGRHDDQVDSMSQFLTWARTGRSRTIGMVRFV